MKYHIDINGSNITAYIIPDGRWFGDGMGAEGFKMIRARGKNLHDALSSLSKALEFKESSEPSLK